MNAPTRTPTPQTTDVVYSDSDGQPTAENTLQFQWIVTIEEHKRAERLAARLRELGIDPDAL